MRFYRIAGVLLAALGLASSACATRAAPYSFRSPLLAGVAADPLQPPIPRPEISQVTGVAATGPAAHRRARQQTLARAILVEPGDSLVNHLRSLVGARDDDMSSASFAIATLRGIGLDVDPDLAGTRAEADLAELARARNAWTEPKGAILGDLLVFRDTAGKRDQASLVALAIRTDRRGVIEFLYLQRGVIRRGFAHPGQASTQRDMRRRVVNTHIRPGRSGDAKGSSYLAGELLVARIDHRALIGTR